MRFWLIAALAVLVSACSSLITPRIDERTGTTLAQRCVDYRATVAGLDLVLAERELSENERTLYDLASLYVAANCAVVAQPAE